MAWFAILKLLLSLAGTVARILQERKLMEAGEAVALVRLLEDADGRVAKAKLASDAVRAGGMPDPGTDPNNRDTWNTKNDGRDDTP